MTDIKQMRVKAGLTQRELAEKLAVIDPRIDAVLISKMESGLCEPTSMTLEYVEKALASPNLKGLAEDRVIIPTENKIALNGEFEAEIYNRLLRGVCDKYELAESLGISERDVRRVIEGMRRKGMRIGSSSRKKGYFLCEDEKAYKAFEKEYLSHAYQALRTAKAMRESKVGQMAYDI